MNSRGPTCGYLPRGSVAAVALLMLAAMCGMARADTPHREFLNGLRLRGYYDMALAYLDRVASRDDLPPAFAETLDYERGITLELAAGKTDDPGQKTELLDSAIERLKSFVQAHPDHPLNTTARYRMGAVLATRAQLTANQLDWSGNGQEARRRAASARAMCDEASAIFASLQQSIRDRLTAMPAQPDPVTDAGLIDERNRLRSHYVEVQLLQAAIVQNRAQTYAAGSREHLEALQAAAAEYHQIYTKYSSRIAGLYARLYEGRCRQQAGDLDGALTAFDELVALDAAASPFLDLKTEALSASLDCRLGNARQEYARAVEMGEQWLAGADDARQASDAGIEILQRIALAHRRLADASPSEADAAERHRQRAAELERLAVQYGERRAEGEASP